jgi:MobA/MobL family
MAIQYARARYIKRSEGGSAVRQACYNARLAMASERTGEHFDWRRKGHTLEHHEILLPPGCPDRLADSSVLWNAAETAEKRKDAQVAREVILALPADREITRAHRLEMARGFAEHHFVSKGLAVQVNLHRPHQAETGEETSNYHAHLLITTRRLEGEAFSAKKARDLDPQVRHIGQRPVVAEGELWGEAWRDYQNDYFGSNGIEIAVDAIAPVPGQHLGPNHFRNPDSERAKDAAARVEANAEAARDPAVVHDRLKSRGQVIDGAALERFLSKHIKDPDECRDVREKVLNWDRETLTKTALLDHVPSGWRLATVEDVARELSPEYADRVKYDKRQRELIARTEKAMRYRENDAHGSKGAAKLRWWEMNWAQKTLHVTGLWRDQTLDNYQKDADRARRSHHRLAVRRGTYTGQRQVNERLTEATLDELKPELTRVLAERQREAEMARAALAAAREAARSPDVEPEQREQARERTRGRDRDFEL